MRPLTAPELLQVWEDTAHTSPTERSLRLLAMACPDATATAPPSSYPFDDMSALSIGERDARLLQLRIWMFGSLLRNKTSCPACGQLMEWTTEAADLLLQLPEANAHLRSFDLQADDIRIRFRLPNSRDLAGAPEGDDPRQLLAACILAVERGSEPLSPADLSDSVWEAVDAQMQQIDPQADIRMAMNCPSCKHPWEVNFDIGQYLWAEIDNWARHITHEVYLLARSFGWSEHDILAMTPRRRQLYLEMIS
jgi:hypothetical protein